jgi:hypothetical protein
VLPQPFSAFGGEEALDWEAVIKRTSSKVPEDTAFDRMIVATGGLWSRPASKRDSLKM